MTRIQWNASGDRIFHTGLDRGVLFVEDAPGVPWNGLVGLSEQPSEGTVTPRYIDGRKYLNTASIEEYAADIRAYTYPDIFEGCDGVYFDEYGVGYGQQERKPFSVAYRSLVGNDLQSIDFAYRLHVVYDLTAEPSSVEHATISSTVDPGIFSWRVTSLPVEPLYPGLEPVSHIIFDSRRVSKEIMEKLEEWLYGTAVSEPRLPRFEDFKELFVAYGMRIEPNTELGIANLVSSDVPDLTGNTNNGIYGRYPTSRLVESSQPGIFTLEE